jgi:VWFA-related protein
VRGRILLVMLAALLPGGVLAQDQAAVTFRSGVDLVRFDVRVVDADGRPITDLKPEEIRVVEQGSALPVVLFQRISEPSDTYVEDAIRASSAEVSSNEAFPRGHLYILIFDQQHITPGNEQRARMAAEQFIRLRVRPNDRVALYAVPGPGPQIGFTADKLRAIDELSSIRGSYERTVQSPLGTMGIYQAHRIVQGDDRLIVETLARVNSEAGSDVLAFLANPLSTTPGGTAADDASLRRILIENARTIVSHSDSQSRQFLQRLADLMVQFRDIEGRKTVVLFSEGFFQDNLARELEDVAAAAAQAYCVFYTFDLNNRAGHLNDAHASEIALSSEIQARIAPMATLAVETDGQMIVDAAARVGKALETLASQAQEYYLVGFTPSDEARANRGSYRRVSVRVTRPGARVSARTGYALAADGGSTDRRRAINTVIGAPFVQQGLRVDYTTYVMKASDGGQHRVVLSLDAGLPVRAQASDAADVVFVVRDVRDGRVVASGTDVIPLPSEAARGSALGSGAWRVQFAVPAGTYMMRTVVREPGGLVGSADRRLEVRALDGPDVGVSDLVVGSAIGGLPVRPRAYAGDGLTGLIETYGRAPHQLADLQVRMEVRTPDGARVVASGDAHLREAEADGSGVTRRADIVVPLESVPPGEYVAHAIVRAGGEVVGERTRHVEVLAGRAPAARGVRADAESVAPVEIIRGDLARRYLAWVRQRAQNTPAADAARLAGLGRWEQVEIELGRAPGEPGVAAHALRGLALFVREDYAAAAAALGQTFDAAPDHALTAFFLGWAQEGAGDPRAAIGAWRSAAHLDPTMVSAHLALADGYLRLSLPALAVQALKAGLTRLPSSPELLAKLQEIEKFLNDIDVRM